MAPPLSRSILGVSSAKALHFPCAPSSFSTATSAAFIRFGSRRGFRYEVSSVRLGAFGGEYSMGRASFTSARFCSCPEVLAHDCIFSRGYSFLREEHNVFICNSLKSVHFSTDTSDPHGPPGLDDNDVEPPNDNLLVDCGPDQECVTGGIVALGKFDALHLGHRQLAIQASRAGTPFLLSFVGIAEVLGWEYRAPIVAKCDRKRVLSTWAPLCGDVVPLEFHVEFSRVRHLSPREFVERLSKDLRISGVVAGICQLLTIDSLNPSQQSFEIPGENYRFGYRASGDAAELVGLCQEYGLEAHILGSVLDGNELVSSTRVREALDMGDMDNVAQLLGRQHRLVLRLPEDLAAERGKILSVPRTWALNQEPREGLYKDCKLLVNNEVVGPCQVTITRSHLHVELLDGSWPRGEYQLLGIDFGR